MTKRHTPPTRPRALVSALRYFPVVRFEEGRFPGRASGLAANETNQALRAVVIKIQMAPQGKTTGPVIFVRRKVFARGGAGWRLVIL